MTPSDDHFDIPLDDLDDQQDVVIKVLELFEEKELTTVHYLTVVVTILAYTYLTRLKDQKGILDFCTEVGTVVFESIPMMELVGTDAIRYGDKP